MTSEYGVARNPVAVSTSRTPPKAAKAVISKEKEK
jgi:hypothetical protein